MSDVVRGCVITVTAVRACCRCSSAGLRSCGSAVCSVFSRSLLLTAELIMQAASPD